MKKLLLVGFLFLGLASFAQVGIGTATPNRSTMLDVSSTKRGVLLPNVALTGIKDVTTVVGAQGGDYAQSLLVYNTSAVAGLTPGYYFWKKGATPAESRWSPIFTAEQSSLAGNSSTTINTANYTLKDTDDTILSDAAVDATFTLPDPTSLPVGKKYTIKKIVDNDFLVTVLSAGGATIDGAAQISGSIYLQGWVLQTDGTKWFVLSRF